MSEFCLTRLLSSSACPGRFQCSNNLCLPNDLHCDGWNHCGDGSDEVNCSECGPSQPEPVLYRTDPFLCLRSVWSVSAEVQERRLQAQVLAV